MMARLLSRATITLMYRLLSVGVVLFATSASVSPSQAGIVTFGTGTNQFQMEFVTIGNPGNAADTSGTPHPAGAVGYTYGMGKFEVSEDMINKFNASQSLHINKNNRGVNKPATNVSWNEAARFVNWLNTSTGGFAAYKFTTAGVNDNIILWTSADALDYDPLNPYRSKRATYVLPSYNEWYKAAYYNPSNRTYYNFPNGSDTAPTAVQRGTAENTAVYGGYNRLYGGYPVTSPADVDHAGGLSPYGVMGLGGNVVEWEESSFDLLNNSNSSVRGIRGGCWADPDPGFLLSWSRNHVLPDPRIHGSDLGFRVASVTPFDIVTEPSSLVIGTLFGLGGLLAKRRMKQ